MFNKAWIVFAAVGALAAITAVAAMMTVAWMASEGNLVWIVLLYAVAIGAAPAIAVAQGADEQAVSRHAGTDLAVGVAMAAVIGASHLIGGHQAAGFAYGMCTFVHLVFQIAQRREERHGPAAISGGP